MSESSKSSVKVWGTRVFTKFGVIYHPISVFISNFKVASQLPFTTKTTTNLTVGKV